MLNPVLIKDQLKTFLNEDLGFEDVSTQFLPADQSLTGQFIVKQPGVLCGQDLPQLVYDLLGTAVYHPLVADGKQVSTGDVIGQVSGTAATLLSGERVILNLMQRMSGISTQTAEFVTLLNDSRIKITDTRKTIPGLRVFDKYAVSVGGGVNHRFDLTNAVMLKDNHIALAGGVTAALTAVKKQVGPLTPIEVEVETEEELNEAIQGGANVIMFDNQSPETVKSWRKRVPAAIKVEASGGISRQSIASFRGCGADFISVGQLTNNATPLDISFLVAGAVKKTT